MPCIIHKRTILIIIVALLSIPCIARQSCALHHQIQKKIFPNDGSGGDEFGYSISIDGGVIVVGARYDDDKGNISGSAYVYRYNGRTWEQEAKLTVSDGAANDRFGHSVSISGEIIIVGALMDDDKGMDSGSAYISTGIMDQYGLRRQKRKKGEKKRGRSIC